MPCLAPIAKAMQADDILCSQLEIENDIITGNLNQQVIGLGKVEVMQKLLEKDNIQAKSCYAYGDDISDLPMLELVGHARVVKKSDDMIKVANQNGWLLLEAI